MADRASINQKVQIAVETTSGTAVPANRSLNWGTIQLGIESDIKQYLATGHKYTSIQVENMEWTSGSMDGPLDFNASVYPLSGAMGSTSPVASGASTLAKDWIFTPPITGNASPKTFTIEQGDAVRAHKLAYGLFTQWGYKGTRKDFTTSTKLVGQLLTDGITMTSSPTSIALAPMVAKQFNVFLDTTQAGLGTTKLTRVLSVEFNMDNIYNPAWFINRSDPSWSTHIDTEPKTSFKLMLEADATGMGLLTPVRDGSTRYIRVEAQGALLDNIQTVTLGSPSAGTFTLTYKGQTTSALAFNAAASAVQTAFVALSTVGSGNATVSGSAGGPYSITFPTSGTLSQDTTAITGSGASLTGGTFAITQSQVYNAFKHDIAVKIGKPAPWSDSDGVFAIEYECVVVEDASWGSGTAHQITLTNLLTSL
jgi:hypothetical protein